MKTDFYDNEEWLREQYTVKHLSKQEIANICSISVRKLERRLSEFGIHRKRQCTYKDLVPVKCSICGQEVKQTRQHVNLKTKKGDTVFYCPGCQNKIHSERLRGKHNPNYGGTYHGPLTRDLPEEKRREMGRKISTTLRTKGISKGRNNHRWAGGRQQVTCLVCGKKYEVGPYVYRDIQQGKRKPLCCNTCKRMYCQLNQKGSGTAIEIKIRNELDRRGISFIEQYNLGNKFSLDFFLPDFGIVIECDGDYWHNLPKTQKHDKSKNAYIKACGLILFRFWEHEINESTEGCVDKVAAVIGAKTCNG